MNEENHEVYEVIQLGEELMELSSESSDSVGEKTLEPME